MAEWGRKDQVSLTGTVSVTNDDTTVTGDGTVFTTEVKVGNVVWIDESAYVVAGITDDTTLTLALAYAGSTDVGLTMKVSEAPVSGLLEDPNAVSLYNDDNVSNTAGVSQPGWVAVKTFGDRTQYETLVCFADPTGS